MLAFSRRALALFGTIPFVSLILGRPARQAIGSESIERVPDSTFDLSLTVNGVVQRHRVSAQTTLLDLLRETCGLRGTKKGCGRGQCGCCTILVDGKRVYSCLLLAAMCEGKSVVTIEGISAQGLHPLQSSFVAHDALQCGFCTPGQICSGIGLLKEADLERGFGPRLADAYQPSEVRDHLADLLSGNICRCGAYIGIRGAMLETINAFELHSDPQ